jgi:RNA-directed DNA polymerase
VKPVADIKDYFDTIAHDRLLSLVKERISDGRVLELIEQYLKQAICEEAKEWTPKSGSPQGAVISPLLLNLYLHTLDQRMKKEGRRIVRYADDVVILCENREEAEEALKALKSWTEENGLTLKP